MLWRIIRSLKRKFVKGICELAKFLLNEVLSAYKQNNKNKTCRRYCFNSAFICRFATYLRTLLYWVIQSRPLPEYRSSRLQLLFKIVVLKNLTILTFTIINLHHSLLYLYIFFQHISRTAKLYLNKNFTNLKFCSVLQTLQNF